MILHHNIERAQGDKPGNTVRGSSTISLTQRTASRIVLSGPSSLLFLIGLPGSFSFWVAQHWQRQYCRSQSPLQPLPSVAHIYISNGHLSFVKSQQCYTVANWCSHVSNIVTFLPLSIPCRDSILHFLSCLLGFSLDCSWLPDLPCLWWSLWFWGVAPGVF